MAQVTGGLVSVEDGIKKLEEYAPPRKVRVELTFSVEEGGDYEAIFTRTSEAASNRVASLLGQKPTAVVTAPAAEKEADIPRETGTRKRRTKAEIAADEAAAAAGTGSNAADPSAMEDDPTGGQGPSQTVIQLPDGSKDPASLEDVEVVEEVDFDAPIQPKADVVSDADLNSAVQRRNADLNDPDLIRGLIGSYNPAPDKPFQLRQIPAEKRAEFLTKLAALTKAA